MMNRIIENINVYKHKSVKQIVDNQIAYIPLVEPDQIEYMCFNYLVGSRRVIINQKLQCCFRLRYIKEKFMPPRKATEYSVGEWSLSHLIDNEVIQPFMLFINGRFIPWTLIKIARTQNINYLTVDTTSDTNFTPLMRSIQYVQMVTLPSHMKYIEDWNFVDHENGLVNIFTFNEYGIFTPDSIRHVIVSNNKNHVIHKFWSTTVGVNAFPVIEQRTVKLTGANVILFKNGLFATGPRFNTRRGFDWENKDDKTGEVFNYYLDLTDRKDIEQNPSIKFDSELLTIGDGTTGDPPNRYDFGVFINTEYTETCDNINRTSLEGLAPWIRDQTSGVRDPDFIRDLQKPFEMEMSRKKKYGRNVMESLIKMMGYNTSFFNDVFKDTAKLQIEERTGEWALHAVHSDGNIVLSRRHNEMNDEYILMMVNGKLYKYTNMIKYKSNHCYVPLQGVNYEDEVDVFRFKNVNNYVSNITINLEETFKPYADYMINDDMVLFSSEPDIDYYNYPEDGLQHFPVQYYIQRNDVGNIRIVLTNPKYYGKPLKVAYRNRYIHAVYHIKLDNPDVVGLHSYKVNLGNKFMYCNDYKKYMVFLNGTRLASDQFRLVLPVRSGTPFYDFKIYLTTPVSDGDQLDIFYVPCLMQDLSLVDIPKPYDLVLDVDHVEDYTEDNGIMVIDTKKETPSYNSAILEAIHTRTVGNGDIIVDKRKLGYPLSKDLYMVWVNGKRVPTKYLVDIDSTYMKIVADIHSTHSVYVTKYIEDIDILAEVFHGYIREDFSPSANDTVFDLKNDDLYTVANSDPNVWQMYKGTPADKDIILKIIQMAKGSNPSYNDTVLEVTDAEIEEVIKNNPYIFDVCLGAPAAKDLIVDVIRVAKVLRKYLIEVPYKPELKDIVYNAALTKWENVTANDFVFDIISESPAAADVLIDISKAVSYKEFESIWDRVFGELSTVQICSLLGINADIITDTEPHVHDNGVSTRAIMNELMRQEVMLNNNVDLTTSFKFDYDDVDNGVGSIGLDSVGNVLYGASDGNSTENINIDRTV